MLGCLLGLLGLLGTGRALAFVAGQPPAPLSSHRIFGDARAIGGTLMLPGPFAAEIRSVLLPSSSSVLSGLPADAVIEKAFLFWSGSLAQDGVAGPKTADPLVTFTVGSASFPVNAAAPGGWCTTVVHPTLGTTFPPFYYCRADVTAQVAASPQGGDYNGSYGIANVAADPGHVDSSGNCIEGTYSRCQAKYAGWSLVVIYRADSASLQRDVHLYDGFLVIDHEDGPGGSLGQTTFSIGNFLADASPQATLSYFAVEGDEQLGLPPQDLYPPSHQLYCDTCEDFVRFNGTTLTDERGWPGNIFNESTASGVDIDSIDVSALVPAGSTSATITVGSGTGPVLPTAPIHGGGELFGYGWTLLSLRRPAPNFKTAATTKVVNPTQAGQGETVAFNVVVTNAGSLPATATQVTDSLPPGLIYTPGTMQIGGVPCTDAADSDPCTATGNTLTFDLGTVTHLPPGNSRQLGFLATVAPGAASGQTLCNTAQITSVETPLPHSTPPACLTVVAPELGTPTKVALDIDGGSAEPGDVFQYTVTISSHSPGAVSGLSFVDEMPAHLQLLSVIPPPGAQDSSTLTGGSNGTGLVDVRNITIPAGVGSVTVTILARVDSVAEFEARGVSQDQIHGRSVCNQGQVQAAFLAAPLLTDDPAVAGLADPTCFALTYAPALGSSNKSVVDLDGGNLEPGDVLRYTLGFVNSGNRAATLTVTDDLPPQVTGFVLLSSVPGAIFNPPPAGFHGTGQLIIAGLVVPPGTTEVQFEVQVVATAPHETPIQNCAAFTVTEAPAEGRTICSPTLTVHAAPELSHSRKTVVDANGGLAQPGDLLSYTVSVDNSGNQPATSVVVTDAVDPWLEDVVVLDGGTFDAASRTITWTIGTVPAKTTVARSFTARIVAAVPDQTQVCNQAQIDSLELPPALTDDPSTAVVGDPTCLTVRSAPDFAATTKTVVDADGAPTRPGDTLRYTIIVRNTGTEDGTGVTVTDVVPVELTGVVVLDGGSFDVASRTITWALGDLLVGAERTLRFEAQVVSPLDDGTPIDNQAFVTADQRPLPGDPSDDPTTPAPSDPTRVIVTAAPDLTAFEKTVVDDNGGVPQPGDALTYTVTLINSGDAVARDVVVTDAVAADLTAVAVLDGGVFNSVTRTITWPARDVAPGAPQPLRFTAQIAFPLADGTVICNQARAQAPLLPGPILSDDPTTAAPGDPTCLTVQSQPDLSNTTKTVHDLNGGAVEPGDQLRYTITVDNGGTADATSVVVSDVIDANLQAVSVEDGGTYDAATRTATWVISSVPAKSQLQVHFTATVALPLDDATQIPNQAQVFAAGLPPVLSDDPTTPASDDPTVVTVSAAPVFVTSTKAVVDDDGGLVEPGDTLTYTLTVVNSGNSAADNVVVSDALDPGLVFVSADQGGTFDATTRTVTWSAASTPQLLRLEPGQPNQVLLTLVARVVDPIAHATELCNQARIASDELTAPEPTDNPLTPAPGDPTCVTVSSAPDLSNTTKTVIDDNGGDVRPGDSLTYTIQITNTGNAPATQVVVTDVVDQALTAIQPGQGGSYDPVSRTITWTATTTPALAEIAADPAQPLTLSFSATVRKPLDNGTVISNQAQLTGPDLAQPVLTDDPTTPLVDDPTRVTVVAAPDLSRSEKTVVDDNGGDPVPGDLLTYTITVKNTGDALARQVVVTDVVNPALTQVTPLDGGSYDPAARRITWTVPQVELSPAGDVRLRFRARIVSPLPNGTVIPNQALVRADGVPAVPTDDPTTPEPGDPTLIAVVSRADLGGLIKRIDNALPGRRVRPGMSLNYTIEVTNTGTDAATDVTITDVVDPRLEQVQPLLGGSYDAATRTISWQLAAIQVNQTVTLGFSARVSTGVRDGTVLANQAFLEVAGEPGRIASDDPTTPQPSDPTRVTIESSVDLAGLEKTVVDDNGGDAVPGDTLTYTITVRNSGTAAAFNVEVVDPLPPELELVSVGQGGRHDPVTRRLTWNRFTTPALAELEPAPADPVRLTFVGRIRVPTPNGTLISNQAFVRADGHPAEPSDDPTTPVDNDPTVVRVVSVPRLTDSTKQVRDLNGGLVRPGDDLEYVIRVINSGSGDATRVLLVDAIPAYTEYVRGSTRLNGQPVADVAGASRLAAGLLVNSPGLPPGQVTVSDERAAEVRFRVRVRADTQAGTIIANQGLISSAEVPLAVTDDPATATKGDPTQVVVGSGPNLNNTTKTYRAKPLGDDGNGRFDVGEGIRYRVEIPNTGTAAATGVVFDDTLDPHGRSIYVPRTLTLDGRPLTDAADADQGTASGQRIRVAVGRIEPGQTAVITYEVRILDGPQVVNQGTVRSTELQPELTDSDGNDLNGDSPTVVPVGAGRHIRGEKSVLDVDGDFVRPGDELLYTITLFNDGDREERIDVSDNIPASASYVGGSLLAPPGSAAGFDPPPAGQHQRGRLRIGGVPVPAGGQVALAFRVRLADDLESGSAVCNQAGIATGAGLDLKSTEPACALIGSPVGTGGLHGVVFRDIGKDDRVLSDEDQRLAGFQVQAFFFGNPNGTPAAGAVTDEQGRYRLPSLPPGPYTLRVLSRNGVQMGTLASVRSPAGKMAEQDVPVDPSGVIYDSVQGRPLAGMRALLYYDETDPAAAGELVPEKLLGPGQQGQLTDDTGYYKFDVQAGRRYRIEVRPLSTSLQFPSALIPAKPGFAETGPENEVVPHDLPDPRREGADLTYYLRFRVDSVADEVFNNHIPVDPLSALIRLEKRADRARASLGDIVTYSVTVDNRSSRDFVGKQNLVGVEDLLPRGLRLLRDTTRRIHRLRSARACPDGSTTRTDVDGAAVCLDRTEPTTRGGRMLRFGPFELGAGESVRLVYQVAVGLDTRPGQYRNLAVLKDDGFAIEVSNRDEARVTVEADPDLDQGLLLGKVFCDQDGDGRQGRGERGVAGARVYLDNGTYAVTDAFGKYHLRDIDPGVRLVKLDANTLRPGSSLTTDASRVVHFTRGLPAKIDFGVRCRENWIKVQRLQRAPQKKRARKRPRRRTVVPALSLAGDARALSLAADGRVQPLIVSDLAIRSARGPRARRAQEVHGDWDRLPLLRLRRPPSAGQRLLFDLDVTSSAPAAAGGQPALSGVHGWQLTLWKLAADGERQVVRRFSGAGPPPAQIVWDGRLGRRQLLAGRGLYEAQLQLIGLRRGARSPYRRFAIGGAAGAARPATTETATLDGQRLRLDAQGRFATTVGRPQQRALLVRLERGDGKSSWTTLGRAMEPDLEPPERLLVEGSLSGATLKVGGESIDTSLLRIALAPVRPAARKATPSGQSPVARKLAPGGQSPVARKLAPGGQSPASAATADADPGADVAVELRLDRRGRLARPVQLAPRFSTALVQRWTVRISDGSGRAVRSIGGLAPVPDTISWDGQDDAGVPAVRRGATYFARLILYDGRGNLGQSPPLTLRAPLAPLSGLDVRGRQIFSTTTGAPLGAARRRLRRLVGVASQRAVGERYSVEAVIAPPIGWKPERGAALLQNARAELDRLLQGAGLAAERYELKVGALPRDAAGANRTERLSLSPIPRPPVVPPRAQPTVRVDGESLELGSDGAFRARVKVQLGSAMVIDLRDRSGRRALLIVPTRPKTAVPTSRAPARPVRSLAGARVAGSSTAAGELSLAKGTLDLRMRNGGALNLRLAQAAASEAVSEAAVSEAAASEAAASQPAASQAAAPVRDGRPGSAAPLSTFGQQVLKEAFEQQGGVGVPASRPARGGEKAIAAAELEVDLPPRGVVLKSHDLVLRGRSHPDNEVEVNGAKVALRGDGTFTHTVTLPDGKSELVIRSRDRQGNVGTIRWPVRVSDRALFLMVLAEGAIGQPGVELDEDSAHSRVASDALLLRGRTVVYLKGRIQGRHLFKRYLVTAHVDTAKQREFEDFFDQVVDPNRYYPIYGDSAEQVRDVNARGKFYVLVEADRSKLVVGNFHAGVRGIDLLRYDRALHGVKVDLDKQLLKGKLRAEARAFVSDGDSRLARDHNVLRATGGSIYYLRHGQVLEGSEQVRIVVRERDTGLKLAEAIQGRDVDYVIDYPGGRIMFKSAVASVADAGFAASNPTFTLSTLSGHPVYVEVDYEHEADGDQGGRSWSAQARTTLFDVLTVGGTYVSETRAAQLGADYQLYGAELTYRFRKQTVVAAELARSESFDSQNFISEDGGVTYLALNHTARASADERAAHANAIKIAARLELSDFVRSVEPGRLKGSGYYARLDRGFFAGGTILDQGRTRYGGQLEWAVSDRDLITLRHDGAVALLPQLATPGSGLDPLMMREIETELTRLGYQLRRGGFELKGEYAHGYDRDPLRAGDAFDSHRDTVSLLTSYRVTRWLRLTLGQDAIVHVTGTDQQLGLGTALGLAPLASDDPLDRAVTTLGAALQLTKKLELQVTEQLRWSGDNATSIGVRAKLSETASSYVKQLFGTTDDHFSSTTVVGAEDRFGARRGGRTYGEYQLESGVLGRRNRAILGLDHKWTPWRGVGFVGGYEHQQVFGGRLPDGTPTGDSQRDVVHLGLEYVRPERFKLGTRAELRYDLGSGVGGMVPATADNPRGIGAANVDPRQLATPAGASGNYADRLVTPGSFLLPSVGERWQFVGRSGASWAATRALTLMARLNYYRTFNTTEKRVEAEALELGFGAALRPPDWDAFNLLLKYTRVLEMRPISLSDDLSRRRTYDVVSVVPILELPLQLQLVEKLAYKRVQQRIDLLAAEELSTVVHTLLWINRLNLHLTGRLDAGVEYRFLRMFLAGQGDQLRHGALVEVGYWVHRLARLGAGYNFSRFSDNEFVDQDRDASGFFFRVVGRY